MEDKTIFIILIAGAVVLSVVTFIVLLGICRKFAQMGAYQKEEEEKEE